MAEFNIEWEAPEFEYREKDVSWYWITIIVAACLIAFSVWEKNFLFGFFVVIAEIMVILWGNEKPRTISFVINEEGIGVGPEKTHSFKEFENWSTENLDEEWSELMFNFRGRFKLPLKITAPKAAVEEIRKNLKTILREVEYQPSLIDAIEKLLRF